MSFKPAIFASVVAGLLGGCATMPASEPPVTASAQADILAAGFADPPSEARPRTWWHWMNGNITQEGIARDLAWFDRIGLGGFQNFDASLGTPQIVDERLVYMTPGWKDAFRFAASEAARLDLEMAIAASPGWSETGGPWVPAEDAMKKLVWSQVVVRGGERFDGRVPATPTTIGPFQDLPFFDPLAMGETPEFDEAGERIAVLAVPMTARKLATPRFSNSSGAVIDGAAMIDANYGTSLPLPVDGDLAGELRITYGEPVTLRSVGLSTPGMKKPFRPVPIQPRLEVRDDDGWRKVTDIHLSEVPTTESFSPVTGREFRLVIAGNPATGGGGLDAPVEGAESFDIFSFGTIENVPIAELILSAEPALAMAEEKAGFATAMDYYAITSTDSSSVGVGTSDVVDLSDSVGPDGSLDWTPPEGRDWRIIVFGWSLTGKTNHPAPLEATGLEVDKLDPAAVERYLDHYIDMYADVVGPDLMGARGLQAILTDSIEVGATNWTGAMEREFEQRRGYALRPWMPALAGVVLGSKADTEKFLYDYRRTLAEMLSDYHYGTVARVANARGLKVYGEALENGRPMLGDDLTMRSHADVPMAAMWTWGRENNPRWSLLGDMKGASSVAHVYGRPRVAAESMTSANAPWAFAPRDLKRVIDFEFLHGINLPVIHTSVHVPIEDRKPGLSLMIFGQHFNRNDTWAEMARPWIDYIARSSFMLQQGVNVADVAIFVGEEKPLTAQYVAGVPDGLPRDYAFDYVNADMLDDALSVSDGLVVSTGGASYRAIHLGGTSEKMTLATLARLDAMAEAGATIIGMKPVASPSLGDDPADFASLVESMWARANVIESDKIESALGAAGLAPDFEFRGARDADVRFVHRRTGEGDIYFINNRQNRAHSGEGYFRVTGKAPEMWDAETGEVTRLSYSVADGVTLVPLDLGPEDAKFIVFREATDALSREVGSVTQKAVGTVDGEWTVTFQEGRGAPASIELGELASLSEHSDDGVRYFSGVAAYSTLLRVSEEASSARKLWLDLGKVGDVAEVFVNGESAGITWFAPDQVDIAQLVRPGNNTLEVRVANRWINRLIGDKQDGAERVTFVAAPTYRADAPLRPSGLIGPVRLLAED